jgi:DNA polymerase-1
MPTMLIIDGNSLANRAFYAITHLSNSKGVPTNAVYGFMNMLTSAVRRFEPDALFVAFDVSKKVFRHERFPDYKGTRSGMPEDLVAQMPLIKEALGYMNVASLGLEGYEADDIIGTMSAHNTDMGLDTIILSGDRDLFQLVGDRVTVCFPKRGVSDMEMITPDTLMDQYGLKPEDVITMKSLMGDKSDNIPGVAGIGEKTARKLLDQYGTLDGIYAHLEDFSGKKMGQKLADGKDDAYMSQWLATINCKVPLDFDSLDFAYDQPDTVKLRDFYNALELKSLADQVAADLPEEAPQAPVCQGRVWETVDEAVAALLACDPGQYVFMVDLDKEGEPVRFSWRGPDNNTVACRGEWPRLVNAASELLEDPKTYILTDDIKKTCHALLSAGGVTDRIVWDAALTAYLLDPEGSGYGLDRLSLAYLDRPLPAEDDPARPFACLEAVEALRPLMTMRLKEVGADSLYASLELPLADILAQMELTGVHVDVPYLVRLQNEFNARIAKTEDRIEELAGETFNINSTKQLGHILFEVLGLPPVKKTKTGYSTSAEVLETLKDAHPIVQAILDYRQLAKLKSTYVDGLLKLVDENDKVHTSFNQTITATGRLSSTSPNLQNIPVRTEEGRRIRQAFIPEKRGNLLISADYSQIELRVMAHLSGDAGLIDSFNKGEDIHRRTASEVFHVDMEDVTSAQRRTAKAVNFGIIYGQTDFGLSRELGISRSEAQAYIDLYFSRYPQVQEFIHQTIEAARRDGYVTTMMGRRRYMKDINSRNRNLRLFAERTAVNSPIQGSAADIIKMAMLKCDQAIRDRGLDATMLLQVHDELIFEVASDNAAALVVAVRESMENVMKLAVPLKVDFKAGFNWQDMEKI